MTQYVQKFLVHKLPPLSGRKSNEVLKAFGVIESVGSFSEVGTAFQDLSHDYPFSVSVDMTILGKRVSLDTIMLYVVTAQDPESKDRIAYISVVHDVTDNVVCAQLESFFASFDFKNEPASPHSGITEIPCYWETGPVSKKYITTMLL